MLRQKLENARLNERRRCALRVLAVHDITEDEAMQALAECADNVVCFLACVSEFVSRIQRCPSRVVSPPVCVCCVNNTLTHLLSLGCRTKRSHLCSAMTSSVWFVARSH